MEKYKKAVDIDPKLDDEVFMNRGATLYDLCRYKGMEPGYPPSPLLYFVSNTLLGQGLNPRPSYFPMSRQFPKYLP
jgi:hypothetical protein